MSAKEEFPSFIDKRVVALLKKDTPVRRIKRLRTALRFTQKRLAEAVGVGKSAVAAWEQGQYEPSKEAYIELGNIAPSGWQAWWFWSRGGLDLYSAVESLGQLLRDEGAPPTAHQILALPILEKSGPYLSVEAAAGIFGGQEPSDILRLVKSGKVKARRVRGTYLIDSESFFAFIDSGDWPQSATTRMELAKLERKAKK